ncbi:hypothetical protein CDAR_39981 [Caerostris darwini]|uniref:Uncharacterized protein n=1 Tax=Caerostris darwini TaxID=1538125 RepID=A0AAV4RDG1_9ARAC|nr:hypothetical protein CDAR_39981 [Caerostris darwini]
MNPSGERQESNSLERWRSEATFECKLNSDCSKEGRKATVAVNLDSSHLEAMQWRNSVLHAGHFDMKSFAVTAAADTNFALEAP